MTYNKVQVLKDARLGARLSIAAVVTIFVIVAITVPTNMKLFALSVERVIMTLNAEAFGWTSMIYECWDNNLAEVAKIGSTPYGYLMVHCGKAVQIGTLLIQTLVIAGLGRLAYILKRNADSRFNYIEKCLSNTRPPHPDSN